MPLIAYNYSSNYNVDNMIKTFIREYKITIIPKRD